MSVGSLADTPVVWRRYATDQVTGARESTTLGTLMARVQPRQGSEALQYGRDLELTPTLVYVAGRVDVQPEDELTTPDGARLLVRHVQDTQLAGLFTAITCERQR
jgi:head-tail adaptor